VKIWEAAVYGGGGDWETGGLWYSKGKAEALKHIRDSERGGGDEWPDDAEVPYPGEEWTLQLIEIGVLNFETLRRCLIHRGYVQEVIEAYRVIVKNGRIVSMTPEKQ
jgi:hypothetical protein